MLNKDCCVEESCRFEDWRSSYKVTAIVSIFRAERFIRGLLDDLEEQTIADELEIIIVDAASDEDERTIIERYQEKNPNIQYVRTGTRVGLYEAWNIGVKLAHGQYLTFANADDRHRPDAFEIMAKELDLHSEVALVYGDNFFTKFANQTFAKHIKCGYKLRPDYCPEIMLSGCHVGPQPMWRRELHEKIGLFDETFESAGDYEFWCRIGQRFSMKHIHHFIGVYYDNPQGIVNRKKAQSIAETLKIQKDYASAFPAPSQQVDSGPPYYAKEVCLGKFVNICMVTYNRLEFTRQAIPALLEFTRFPHVITVVDNGSTDGTVDYLRGVHKEGIITNLILLKENVGVAKASNLAWIQEPDAQYYMKFDNDIVIQKPNWLEHMVEVIDAIPELAMVGYNFEPSSYPLQNVNGQDIRPKRGNLGGACVLIPKRTEQQIGYWCEDYGYYGEEDADYGNRIRLAGLASAYMEEEQIGCHLPAGRAAYIDSNTFRASDGIEEESHATYRTFKDECRRKNIQEVYQKYIQEYETGVRSLYCSSNFVKDFEKNKKRYIYQQRDSSAIIQRSEHLPVHDSKDQASFATESPLQDRRKNESSLNETFPQNDKATAIFDCSIIIPVFNKADLTRQCLMTLSTVTDGCSYEVLLVDNNSMDGTKEFLATLGGDVQVISNPENLGFAKACNQGAAVARGRFLVFLNNDTIPIEGWLSALVREIEDHPEVAVVGSKLLYPDDTIQHAGVVFSRFLLTPYHLFNGAPGNLPAANVRKEFQAVTAACMLVSKETFEQVQGYDEGFVNGYEDVDLCLKIGQLGKTIVYQPSSCLYHLESQTPGRKDHESSNAARLLDRWGQQWLVDEDIYAVSEGLIIRIYELDGKFRYKLDVLPSGDEGAAWQRVVQVERILLSYNKASDGTQGPANDSGLKNLLSDPSKWPADVEVLRWAISLCRRLRWTEMIADFARKILVLGEDQESREHLARCALERGDQDEARVHLDNLFLYHSPGVSGYVMRGVLAMQDARFTDAHKNFAQAIALTPEDRKAGLGLGMAYMGMGEPDKAWVAFQDVKRMHPDDVETMNWLLQAGTLLERWEALHDDLVRFVDRNPANCDMRFALAGVCCRLRTMEEAMMHYEALQVLSPNYEGLKDLEQQIRGHSLFPESGSLHKSNSQMGLFDNQRLQAYSQPSVGNTEQYIRVVPSTVTSGTVSVHQALEDYTISGFATGLKGVEQILPIVFERQFGQTLASRDDFCWDEVAVLTVDCRLLHKNTGQSFRHLRPTTLEDIDVLFEQQEGENRKEEILTYVRNLTCGENLGMPLYISGKVLQHLGAPAEDHAIYMLDGARRITASALSHRECISILLLVHETEFAKLLCESVKKGIRDRVRGLTWFNSYHSLPLLDIVGERTFQRFQLMDRELLKNSVVLDFGCNVGQASLKAVQLGAKEVWGIEGMSDTLQIANEIKHIAGCNNLHYLHVDFNDPYFDQQIDQHIPGFCDYAFFFSVYRTKELTQRDRLFRYILEKATKGVFFEGHADPKIDTLEYYNWLFDSFQVTYTFLGYSEQHIRPLFYLDLQKDVQASAVVQLAISSLHSR